MFKSCDNICDGVIMPNTKLKPNNVQCSLMISEMLDHQLSDYHYLIIWPVLEHQLSDCLIG
jgi:hypothetical protein